MSSMLTRRKLLTTTAAGASTAAACSFPRPALSQPVKVRYTLSWLPTGQYAFTLTASEWEQVRSTTDKYAKSLGTP
jgi:hypothetical protein